jgi:hypothetical protein
LNGNLRLLNIYNAALFNSIEVALGDSGIESDSLPALEAVRVGFSRIRQI